MNAKKAPNQSASASRSKKSQTDKGKDDYIRLRTMLDSLEIGALRYFLAADDSHEGERRLKELEKDLMPLINKLWKGTTATIDCPDGYTNCGNCCVPYNCPGVVDGGNY